MSNIRLWIVFVFVITVTLGFSVRLFHLQILTQENWAVRAEGQQKLFEPIQGKRGDIYFKNNNDELILAATDRNIYNAFISPRELKNRDIDEFIHNISKILNINKRDILPRLQKSNSAFEVLKKNLNKQEVEEVSINHFIYLQEESVRYYPEDNMASHVLGFVGGEKKGQYGIEQYYENNLKGSLGMKEGLKTPWGNFIAENSANQGEVIVLTIDYNIQHFVEKRLQEGIERFNATGGTILVGDPHTGKIIALANYPDFNPNYYSLSSTEKFKNPAIQETFEPGSVFKPLIMAIAIEEGVVTADDKFYDTGVKRIHGRVIYNYAQRAFGEVDMTEIIKRSINTGMIYVQEQIDNEVFVDYLRNFGFFTPTGIDLHGEIHSANTHFLSGYDANYATASYGMGIEINAMQLFRAFSALANGGKMVDPHVVENINREQTGGDKIISSRTALTITEMLIETTEDGFGKSAKVPGYNIAGKTGTALIPWSKLGVNKKGYSTETIQSFIGFAPALDPQFVIFVKLNQPNVSSAEVSTAPIFNEIADYIFKYKQIPHDYDI